MPPSTDGVVSLPNGTGMASSPQNSSAGRAQSRQRGSSYRKSLVAVIDEYEYVGEAIEKLEEKRRQLDDSIHKYIASKEKEYKQFEKDLRAHYRKIRLDASNQNTLRRESQSSNESAMTDTSQLSAADTLLATGARQRSASQTIEEDEHGQNFTPEERKAYIAGIKNRRESNEREKDFVGLFTPPFLALLDDDKSQRNNERAASAPPLVEPSSVDQSAQLANAQDNLQRSNTDPALDKPQTRPARLKLEQRTSSSGSSFEGKASLISAMRAPGMRKQREPKKKRVSLAVDPNRPDEVVYPTDNVPENLTNSHAPSHSRVRSPSTEKEVRSGGQSVSPNDRSNVEGNQNSPSGASSSGMQAPPGKRVTSNNGPLSSILKQPSGRVLSSETASGMGAGGPASGAEPADFEEPESPFAMEEDIDGLRGPRVVDLDFSPPSSPERQMSPTQNDEEDEAEEDENILFGGLESPPTPGVEFRPSSSQQPALGFGRPSVTRDPVFPDDAEPEYTPSFVGSGHMDIPMSFSKQSVPKVGDMRPLSGGSLIGTSLGESYMERHAHLMKQQRSSKQSTAGAN